MEESNLKAALAASRFCSDLSENLLKGHSRAAGTRESKSADFHSPTPGPTTAPDPSTIAVRTITLRKLVCFNK
jgi:hypothetical protein